MNSTALCLGQLPWAFTMSVLAHAGKKAPGSNPHKSMSVGCSLSLHRVGFTSLSFNNVLVCLYKVLQVHHGNWITCFNTVFYQSHPHIFFKIPEKLQRVKYHCAARMFCQPLRFTQSAISGDVTLQQQLYFLPSNQDNCDWLCYIFRTNRVSFPLIIL